MEDFMESKNVQLANFILQQAVIKPFMSEDVKNQFEEKMFNFSLVKALLATLKLGEKASKNYTEFL